MKLFLHRWNFLFRCRMCTLWFHLVRRASLTQLVIFSSSIGNTMNLNLRIAHSLRKFANNKGNCRKGWKSWESVLYQDLYKSTTLKHLLKLLLSAFCTLARKLRKSIIMVEKVWSMTSITCSRICNYLFQILKTKWI